MTYTCPKCGKENKVAGWRGWVFNQDGRQMRSTLNCAFCGEPVTEESLKPKGSADGSAVKRAS